VQLFHSFSVGDYSVGEKTASFKVTSFSLIELLSLLYFAE